MLELEVVIGAAPPVLKLATESRTISSATRRCQVPAVGERAASADTSALFLLLLRLRFLCARAWAEELSVCSCDGSSSRKLEGKDGLERDGGGIGRLLLSLGMLRVLLWESGRKRTRCCFAPSKVKGRAGKAGEARRCKGVSEEWW